MKVNIIKTLFKDIDYGDVFYAYNGAYMKIISSSDMGYNAVNLIDGSLIYFDDKKFVNKLDSELNSKLELVSE